MNKVVSMEAILPCGIKRKVSVIPSGNAYLGVYREGNRTTIPGRVVSFRLEIGDKKLLFPLFVPNHREDELWLQEEYKPQKRLKKQFLEKKVKVSIRTEAAQFPNPVSARRKNYIRLTFPDKKQRVCKVDRDGSVTVSLSKLGTRHYLRGIAGTGENFIPLKDYKFRWDDLYGAAA